MPNSKKSSMVNDGEKNSKSKRNSKGSTSKDRSKSRSKSSGPNSSSGKQTNIVNISNYDMMLSLAEALHNSKHINDETYYNLKKLLKEEVKD